MGGLAHFGGRHALRPYRHRPLVRRRLAGQRLELDHRHHRLPRRRQHADDRPARPLCRAHLFGSEAPAALSARKVGRLRRRARRQCASLPGRGGARSAALMTPDRRAILSELLRFGAVGAGSTAVYGALGLALATAGWRADLASVFAYAVSTAASSLGHGLFSVGAGGGAQQISRLLLINGIGLGAAIVLPRAFQSSGMDARWGVIAACVAIPL